MNRRLDVLFVIPGKIEQVYQVFAKEHAIEPPAMARWIASYLMRRNCGVEILDTIALQLSPQEAARQAVDINPHLVVVPVYGSQPSASTQTMPATRELSAAIKRLRPALPILVTGTHPAALPERTLLEEPVDFVCDGEGPITIHGTLMAIKEEEGDFSRVPGLWYRLDREVCYNSPAPLIRELDAEPAGEVWSLLDPRLYYAHDWHTGYAPYEERKPYANVLTTMGCPFHCPFCCIQTPFKAGEAAIGFKPEVNSYRLWNPNVIIKEIEYLVENHGITHIKIPDEMFVLNPRHVTAIAGLIAERYGDKLNIWAYARIDTARPAFLEKLRRAGFRWLAYGIEAAESTVRDGQDKDFGDKGDEEIVKIVRLTEDAGINVAANYIFGLPGDTIASMQKTLDLAVYLNTPYANLYCAMAYPGSKLYRGAKEKGLPLPDDHGGPGWIGYSQHGYETMPLPTETLSAAEVLQFRDEAWRKYYTRPEFLEMLRNRPGFGESAVATIVEMTSRPRLKRKLLGD